MAFKVMMFGLWCLGFREMAALGRLWGYGLRDMGLGLGLLS